MVHMIYTGNDWYSVFIPIKYQGAKIKHFGYVIAYYFVIQVDIYLEANCLRIFFKCIRILVCKVVLELWIKTIFSMF